MSQMGAVYEVPARPSAVIKPKAEVETPRRRHRYRNWFVRFLMLATVVIAILGVAIQLILTTDVPRNLVVSGLEKQMGLRVTASSMTSGWLGRSTLEDVTLALPLAEESFLSVPQLKIRHTTLFALLLRRPLHIDEMYFDRPHLVIRQNSLGRWNVEEAMALITRAAGGKSADNEQKAKGEPVQLPLVSLQDGTLELIDNENRKVTFAPLQMRGTPQDSLSWHFQGNIADFLRLEGRIAPGHTWNHQVDFVLQHAQEILKPWFPAFPDPTILSGNWIGQVNNDSVEGRLDLKRGQIGSVGLTGAIKFTDTHGAATIAPEVLFVNFAPLQKQTPIRLTNGSLKITGTRIDMQSLDLGAFAGTARLDGHFDWHARAGEIKAAWADMTLPGQIRHSGEIQASIDTPWAGQPQIKTTLHSQGTFAKGDWNTHLNLLGTGPSWNAVNWTITIPDLLVREPGRQLQLNDLLAHLTNRDNTLTLDDLRVARTDHLRGGGAVNFNTHNWWLWLDTRELELPGFRKPVFISFNVSGNQERVDLTQFYYRSGKFEASATGAYIFALPKPLDLYLDLWRIPVAYANEPQRHIGGMLNGKIRANGTLWPRSMDLSGNLFGNDVIIGRRKLGDVSIQLAGLIDEEKAFIESRELKLFEGNWALAASYNFEKDLTHLDIAVKDLSLLQADSFIAPPPKITGNIAAQLHLDLPHQDTAVMTGRGDLAVTGLEKGNFKAEQITSKLAIESNSLFFDNINLHQGAGVANGSLKLNIRQPSVLSIDLTSQNWPLDLPSNVSLQLSGNTKIELDVKNKSANGPLNLNSTLALKRKAVGTLAVNSNLTGQVAELKSITGNLFDGTLFGAGVFRWDDMLKSTGKIELQNIDSASLAQMWPNLAGIHGTLSGTIEAQPAVNPEVNEPLEISISLRPDNAWYRVMSVGSADGRLFIGHERLVLESSYFRLAHGEVRLWGRLVKHENEFFSHAQMEFKEVSLNELTQSMTPGAAPMSGALDGQLTLFGPLKNAQLLTGEADVHLTRSDLANNGIVGGIYDAMRLHIGHDEPNGAGRAQFRLEQGVLNLTNFYYNNRGVELRASGRALDIFHGGQSPIEGYAVGSARPLREMKLPFFAEADDILNALQKSVTTFRVGGTLGHPQLFSAGFSEITHDLRGFILGDLTSEQRQKSAR
jgi:hypothetical protein